MLGKHVFGSVTMLKRWSKKRKKLKLKRLRLEKAELKYVDLLVQFQELELTLGKIEYDERCHRRLLQDFIRERPRRDYVV